MNFGLCRNLKFKEVITSLRLVVGLKPYALASVKFMEVKNSFDFYNLFDKHVYCLTGVSPLTSPISGNRPAREPRVSVATRNLKEVSGKHQTQRTET